MLRKLILAAVGTVLILGVGIYAAFKLSPWPSVWLIRNSFDAGAAAAKASVAPHIPQGVSAHYGLSYSAGEEDALFDLFAPAGASAPRPLVVWVHGGAFVGGTRSDLSGYLQVLAARGFAVMAIDYTRAPEAQYPTPVRQTNAALAFIVANAARFNIDPARIFLAGDSAGAQIAAQSALVISEPAYASRIGVRPGLPRSSLRGVLLFCGPYDPATLDFDSAYGGFMRTVIWSYLGTRDPRDPRVTQMSIAPHITGAFPPAFISVGNADPLAPQSHALAQALAAQGVEVDALFFPPDHDPPLDHEYQLLLSTEDGMRSLDRSVAFLRAHAEEAAAPANR
jgi:acetyl esterase